MGDSSRIQVSRVGGMRDNGQVKWDRVERLRGRSRAKGDSIGG